jgi:internalin A
MTPEEGYREAERRIGELLEAGPNQRVLDLGGLSLESLPNSLEKAKWLRVLDLTDNKLDVLPEVLRLLSKLDILFAGGNAVTRIPAWLGELSDLRHLSLGGWRITSMDPAGHGVSMAGHSMSASSKPGNQIRQFEASDFSSARISSLDLSNNLLREICLDRLPRSLRSLRLDHNPLENLQLSIRGTLILQHLGLAFTKLQQLPSGLGTSGTLVELALFGLSRLGIPSAIILTSSAPLILKYYNDLKTKGSRPLNESKVLLLGRGEAGKSSIARALRGLPFEKELAETPGIDIHAWEKETPKGDLRVHLWDFAGQEITHETHRFFLTEQSLYLVVLDGRGGQQMEEAEYWLGHAQRYGTSNGTGPDRTDEVSPVLVVLNKWQSPGGYEVEKRRLQREFPNIRGFIEVDCKTGFGVDKLRETVLALIQQMEGVWQEWPLTYFNVRHRLDDLSTAEDPGKRRHFIDWKRFQEICVECGVTELSSQTALAANLHTLGAALYYGNKGTSHLRDTRVLNPNWAANGLYGIIRGVQKLPDQGRPGYLRASRLDEILRAGMEGMNSERGATADDYPPSRDGLNVHEFLLELLIDRELGFLVDDQGLYLLPGLLSADEPRAEEFDVAAFLESPSLRFRYTYEVLPAGVVSRFIVRTHLLSEGQPRWARGVVLEWKDAQALMIADRRRNPRIEFYLRGPSPRGCQELAGIIRQNMEAIHRNLPTGLTGEEELDLSLPGEQFRKVSELCALEEAGQRATVVTRGSVQSVEPGSELDRLQPAEGRHSTTAPLRVFLSYAHANLKLMERLRPHLDVLKNDGKLAWWYDGKIRAGSDWDQEIQTELQEADIVIALISTSFLASTYVREKELPFVRKQRDIGRMEVLPVLLEPTPAFKEHEWLSKLQAAPSKDGKLRPITNFKPASNGWALVDAALREIVARLNRGFSPIDRLRIRRSGP